MDKAEWKKVKSLEGAVWKAARNAKEQGDYEEALMLAFNAGALSSLLHIPLPLIEGGDFDFEIAFVAAGFRDDERVKQFLPEQESETVSPPR